MVVLVVVVVNSAGGVARSAMLDSYRWTTLWFSGNRCQGCSQAFLTPPREPSRNSRPRPIARRRTNDAWTSRRGRPPIGLPSDTVFRLSMTAARPPSPTSRWGAFQFRARTLINAVNHPTTHSNTFERFDSRSYTRRYASGCVNVRFTKISGTNTKRVIKKDASCDDSR